MTTSAPVLDTEIDPCPDPRPVMLALAAHTLAVDSSTLNVDSALDHLIALERLIAHCQARQAEALVIVAGMQEFVGEYLAADDGQDPSHSQRLITVHDAMRDEIAAALRWSGVVAQDRITTARLLCGPLEDSFRALAEGEASYAHVRPIADAAIRLPGYGSSNAQERRDFEDLCEALEKRVVPVALRTTPGRVRTCARMAVLRLDAEGGERRHARALEERNVSLVHEDDGMSVLMARMATERAVACLQVINDAAESIRHDPTEGPAPVGTRRVEALERILLGAGGDGSTGRLRAHVDVVIGLDALLGVTDEPGALRSGEPLAAHAVRQLVGDPAVRTTLRRIIADPVTGRITDVGRARYSVPDRLREEIEIRDRRCRFPGCRQPAVACEVDHAEPWSEGGETSLANLGLLCIRHHQLKTHGGWRIIRSDADGSCIWISPRGRTYVHEPHPSDSLMCSDP